MTPPVIYGLIGYPARHSLSPAMHNAAFKVLGISAEYRLFEVKPEDLEGFLLNKDFLAKDIEGNSIYAKDIVGFNITIPHKVKAREILEESFPFEYKNLILRDLYYVKLSGAVNTVKRDSDGLKYWNTDVAGFLESLRNVLDFETKNKNALLIGCGGAGRAVIAALSWKQAQVEKIYITDIKVEVMEAAKKYFLQLPQSSYLEDKLEFISREQIPDKIKDAQLLVNATPIGMKEGDGSVVDKSLLHKDLFVYDLVYNRETQLIKDAKSKGLNTTSGEGMLLYQGVEAFEFWTAQKAPVDTMRQALNEAINKS
ncbi:MAG: shikimate dehydrogenase [Candidatus Omnitrophica bacterium]|nr:shikimate dehydrogenase [Candidatus Omnitrophota bacterium]